MSALKVLILVRPLLDALLFLLYETIEAVHKLFSHSFLILLRDGLSVDHHLAAGFLVEFRGVLDVLNIRLGLHFSDV
jgi:hypothetical protein